MFIIRLSLILVLLKNVEFKLLLSWFNTLLYILIPVSKKTLPIISFFFKKGLTYIAILAIFILTECRNFVLTKGGNLKWNLQVL
jgi:hypothetical protein